MQLSVIIVNYNVRFFLEQCLSSVLKAIAHGGFEAEVLVVDNNSTDGSIDYLPPLFTSVKFIANKENVGFARANNQALAQAAGEFILFLNPDTIVPENIFSGTLSFMNDQPNAGALGVRMVDGSGRFLKESKRGLPTAWASFCKMSGLATLFPKSKSFAGYYSGHLDEHVTQPADVQAGAFFMVRRQVINKTGGFDERFFMYAEDIDLSYRIQQAGYVNYYFADATIIHFKGESTRKDARYVKLFYKAMHQFVQKHYHSGGAMVFSGLLKAAISLRSGLSLLKFSSNNSSTPPLTIKEVELLGDPIVSDALKNKLRWLDIANTREGAHAGIFCEGKDYSFVTLIQDIEKLPRRYKALIHASGTNSIVGSFDRNGQGLTINLSK